jgi:hypothetical protein
MANRSRPNIHDLYDCLSTHSSFHSTSHHDVLSPSPAAAAVQRQNSPPRAEQTLPARALIARSNPPPNSDNHDVKKTNNNEEVAPVVEIKRTAFIDEKVFQECLRHAQKPESWTSEVIRKQSNDPAYPNPTRLDEEGKNIYQSPLDYVPLYRYICQSSIHTC